MSTAFNPFHKWLGLPAKLTKPNYYQLLGLDEFEEEPAKISTAVDRAISKLQSISPGDREKQHGKLLSQLKHVKQTLLSPQRKSIYDQKLRTSKQTPTPDQTDVAKGPDDKLAPLPPQSSSNNAGRESALPAKDSQPILPPTVGVAVDPMAPVSFSPQAAAMDPVSAVTNEGARQALAANNLLVGQAPVRPSPTSIARNRPRRMKKNMAFGVAFGFFTVLVIAIVAINKPPEQLAKRPGKQTGPPASIPNTPSQPAEPTSQLKPNPIAPVELPRFKKEESPPLADLPDLTSSPFAPATPEPRKEQPTKKKTASKKSDPEKMDLKKKGKQPSAKDLAALGKALTMARQALDERDFAQAETHIKRAETLAELSEHKEMTVRLKTVAMYVQQFWMDLSQVLGEFKGGEEIQVKNTVVSVVDANSMLLVIRVAGMNKSYAIQKLPSGLAMAIAEKYFDENDPKARIMRGAVHLVDENGKFEEVERLWGEAVNLGADIESLLPAINDQYDFSSEGGE